MTRTTPSGLQEQVPLAPLTTLGLGGPARYLVTATDQATAIEALHWAAGRQLPVAVLGGGSNVVVADDGFDGLVLRMAMSGLDWQTQGDRILVTAQAGHDWDQLVATTVAERLAGIECLAGIPGTVGAAPIQNIGAYGQEVATCLHSVTVLDRHNLQQTTLPRDACGFAYRSSRFRQDPDRCLVLAVTLVLHRNGSPTLLYPELRRALQLRPGGPTPDLATVRQTVLELRRRKGMVIETGTDTIRSAGSFFLNPVLTPSQLNALRERVLASGAATTSNEIPVYPAGPDRSKVPAAWLIEAAGFHRGLRRGRVGLSDHHVLALVNHGGTTRELLDLAAEIERAVKKQLGIDLHREPVLVE